MRLLLFTIAFVITNIASVNAGGGWPQNKGKGYFKLSQWWVNADQHYTTNGGIDPNVTTSLYNTFFYGEYGLTDRFTAVINVPLLSRAVVNNIISMTTQEIISEGDAINSLGDIDLTLKYGILNSKVSIAASYNIGLPLGESSGGLDDNLQTGDGELNHILRVDVGIPLFSNDNLNSYANVYAGFNKRTKNFSNELRYGVEGGVGILGNKLWIIGRLDIIDSLMNKEDGPIDGSFFANNSEFTGIAGELSYKFSNNVGLSIGFGGALSGRVIFASPSYSIGVFTQI